MIRALLSLQIRDSNAIRSPYNSIIFATTTSRSDIMLQLFRLNAFDEQIGFLEV